MPCSRPHLEKSLVLFTLGMFYVRYVRISWSSVYNLEAFFSPILLVNPPQGASLHNSGLWILTSGLNALMLGIMASMMY